MPRSRTWAAAARPTGPAPITATVLEALIGAHPSRWIETRGKYASGRIGRASDRGAAGLGAAFVHQEPDQPTHDRIVGAADERCGVALLSDEPDDEQRLEVMR